MYRPPLARCRVLARWRADLGTYTDNTFATAQTSNGGSVGGWKDVLGDYAFFDVATSGTKPTLQTNVVNGLPVLRFSASPLTGISNRKFATYTQLTIFAVVSRAWTSVGSYRAIIGHGSGTVFAFYGTTIAAQDYSAGRMLGYMAGPQSTKGARAIGQTSNLTDNTFHILTVQMGVWSEARVDGTRVSDSVTTRGWADMSSLVQGADLVIGGEGSGSNWDRDIADLVVVGGDITEREVLTVERQLGARYAISVA